MSSGTWGPLADLCPPPVLRRLEQYAAELERWNRSIRLIGPRNAEGVRLQVVDALLPFLLHPPPFPLLDIGSGAGLPALPLAIAHPGAPITCVEPRAKRVSFLRHAARSLDLYAVEVVPVRAQEALIRSPAHRGAFPAVTARAVSAVPDLLDLARSFLSPEGAVYLPRGPGVARTIPGWELLLDLPYPPPPGVGPRRLLAYRPSRGPAGGGP